MNKRKICVVTGTRAEYGLLYWLMKEIQCDSNLRLQVVATGMHLSPEFGLTYQSIEQDGFHIDEKVEMLLSSDTPSGTAKSTGLAVIGFSDAINRLKPDIIVILGDRYEMLAAAQCAMIMGIPIAHICGGERTDGAIDDAIRHAITKMSHLHFVAAEEYRKRVVQLGENPERVYMYGAPGLDNLNRLSLLSREELEVSLSFNLSPEFLLVTYHPVTLGEEDPLSSLLELFAALDQFPNKKVIITKPNSDAGGRVLIQAIDQYSISQPERVYVTTSLGQIRYLSAMKHCSAVIGNSSSGIMEAPALRKPTVNIGIRQTGRLKASSILDCRPQKEDIENAINTALSHNFQRMLEGAESLYGKGDTAVLIKECLKSTDLDRIKKKQFYDCV